MRWFGVAVTVALVCAPAMAGAQATPRVKKPVVSVDDIQDMANTGKSAVLKEMIETAVVNTGKFRVMERSAQGAAVLLDEQNRAKAGLVTSNTPGRMGGFEGVDFKVYGSIVSAGAGAHRDLGATAVMQGAGALIGRLSGGSLGNSVANTQCNQGAASLAVDIRITDGSSGEVKFAKHVTSNEHGQTVCGGPSQVDIGGLLRYASQKISMGLVTIMYPVKVVETEDDGEILLNYGEGLLSPGDIYSIRQQGKEIVDPDTGAVIGHKETFLGLVQIAEVEPKMSKAKPLTAFTAPPPVGSVAREATPEERQRVARRP